MNIKSKNSLGSTTLLHQLENFINKYIKFKVCYLFIFLAVALLIIGITLKKSHIIPKNHFLLYINSAFQLIIRFYILLGLIKFSDIIKLKAFKNIIGFIMIFELVSYIPGYIFGQETYLLFKDKPIPLMLVLYIIVLTPVLLYYFAFKMIKSEDTNIFKLLSRYYLFLFISATVFFTKMTLYSLKIKFHIPFVGSFVLLGILFAGIIFLILIFIQNIKLFKYLYVKYEKK